MKYFRKKTFIINQSEEHCLIYDNTLDSNGGEQTYEQI